MCLYSKFHLQVGQADDGIGNKILINRYDSAIAEKEEDAAYEVDMRTPKIPVVINEYTRNLYGSPRGYKIQLNRPLLNLEPSGYARSKALGECSAFVIAQVGVIWWMAVDVLLLLLCVCELRVPGRASASRVRPAMAQPYVQL